MASDERVKRFPGMILGDDLALEVDAVAAMAEHRLSPQKARSPSIAIRSICPIRRAHSIVGLEPSCIMTFRDEMPAMMPKAEAALASDKAILLEELLAADLATGMVAIPLVDQGGRVAHLHGHCHQKAFSAMGAMEAVLRAVPGLEVRAIESSCCGMAGAFGYASEHFDVSMRMAELSLLPAIRETRTEDMIVANGTSCRHQIRDGAGREAVHLAHVLDGAMRIH